MNQRILIFFLSIVITLSCTKKEENIVDSEEPEFTLELVSFDQNNVNFSYTISTTIEDLKLIWNTTDTINLDNKIGDLEVDQTSNTLFVSNLEQGETYYFRFVGEFNNEIIYSEIIQVTLEPEFSIELLEFNQNSVSFSYTINSDIENINLIWNNISTLDVDNKIGELEVDQDTNELTVPDLEPGEIYYFRCVGEYNSEIIYSEIVEVRLLEQYSVTEYIEILSSVNHPYPINEILELDSGYLFFTGAAQISVSKTDSDFNVLWSFDITYPVEDLFYSGVNKLNGNNDYLLFLSGCSGAINDPWGNTFSCNQQVHGIKFNLQGDIIWQQAGIYSSDVVDNIWVDQRDNPVFFSKHSVQNKLLIRSDSTYYTDNDHYYRKLSFDDNGDINSDEIIDEDFLFIKILFQENNKLINYGSVDLNPNDGLYARDIIIQNFNNYQLMQDYSYGNSGADDYLSSILDNGGNITIAGTNGHENELDGESRWLFNINSTSGEIIWEIKETEEDYSYRARDLTRDIDGNYLSLFFDLYHDFDYATLIKSDNEGNIIWKFVDGEENNSDHFEPQRVFQDGNEYLIIGNKDAYGGLWVKRISNE